MTDASQPKIVRTFLTDMPAVTATAAMTLVERRAAAVTDFWRSFVEVRQPTELLALQMGYCTKLIDDYQDAYTRGLSQLSAPTPRPAAEAEPTPLAQRA